MQNIEQMGYFLLQMLKGIADKKRHGYFVFLFSLLQKCGFKMVL